MLRNKQIRRMYVIDTTGSMEQDIIDIKSTLTFYLDTVIVKKIARIFFQAIFICG